MTISAVGWAQGSPWADMGGAAISATTAATAGISGAHQYNRITGA
jgi:hypothetical protein